MKTVTGTALYHAMQEHSRDSKRCWIATPYLSRDAQNVLDRTFLNASDKRLLIDVKSGAVDRTELERLRESWLAKDRLRTLRHLHAKIYIFTNACIVTSANLSLPAFEKNHEIGFVITDAATMKGVQNVFSTLWKRGRSVTPNDIDNLPRKQKSGDPGGGQNGASRHTAVDLWNEPAKGPEQNAAADGAVDMSAGRTFEAEYQISTQRRKEIQNELRSRKYKGAAFLEFDGYSSAQVKGWYPIGSTFDASDEYGNKTTNWQSGTKREIGRVLAVFNVGKNPVVIYRVLRRYRVDAYLLRTAKQYRVFQGRPRASDMHAYLLRVKRRVIVQNERRRHF